MYLPSQCLIHDLKALKPIVQEIEKTKENAHLHKEIFYDFLGGAILTFAEGNTVPLTKIFPFSPRKNKSILRFPHKLSTSHSY